MYTLTIEYRDDLPNRHTLANRKREVVGTGRDLAAIRALTHVGRERLHALRRAGYLARFHVENTEA